ncbi:hypothetical protein BGI41_03750 [Methanobrevibacter sp. 87.7]|uniref:glycosyltransferase family 2 protein n=1 Tax=Methanobrevibacter sp. 87.7 TaxID=387957 RepID=UPI000B50C199|nr:glycosyltransferase family 2 protein [Methanobrevibacter sp. 87.7]OWT33186.1 hypothetical protein BGI41_03750 [Methanobrevibacter sp. 87.7]
MTNPKVTVIISVYNEEKYLKKALNTILNQSLKDIEVICINDKSSDKSLEIMKEYSNKDERIVLINNKENLGLGLSRNNALKIAKGEYIGFVDGDDWIKKDCLENVYNHSKKLNTDITMFQMTNYNNEDGSFHENTWSNLDELSDEYDNKVFDGSKTKNFLFKLPVSACQKIYKRSFLENIDAKFPVGIYFEDNPFFYYVWLKAKRISIIKKHYYIRRVHSESITGSCDKKFFDIIPSGIELFKIFIKNNFYKDYKKDLINYRIDAYRLTVKCLDDDLLEEFYNLSKEEFKNIYNSPYKEDFLKYMNNKNLKIFNLILNTNNVNEFKKEYF